MISLFTFDVVIPCAEKDVETLEMCISGIRENGIGAERIFVISQRPLTSSALWIDEALFPFSKESVHEELIRDKEISHPLGVRSRIGWYFQQLLKLYAQQVVPDLSDAVLILDADTIFLKKTPFFDEIGRVLMTVNKQYYAPYFTHGAKLIPKWHRMFEEYSGITNHMIFHRQILQEIFDIVEEPFWKTFLHLVDPAEVHLSGASEFELYFNYCLARYPDNYILRTLRWRDEARSLQEIALRKREGYDFISCHAWQRGK